MDSTCFHFVASKFGEILDVFVGFEQILHVELERLENKNPTEIVCRLVDEVRVDFDFSVHFGDGARKWCSESDFLVASPKGEHVLTFVDHGLSLGEDDSEDFSNLNAHEFADTDHDFLIVLLLVPEMINRVLSVVCNVEFDNLFFQVISPVRGSNNSYMNHR